MGKNAQEGRRVGRLVVRTAVSDVRALALELHGLLVEATPVDTGWARNNWLPTVGKPAEEPAGTPEAQDSVAAGAGLAEALSWTPEKGPIFITNNVPYIGRLNAGSSQQAPAGFVEKAIQDALDKHGGRRR